MKTYKKFQIAMETKLWNESLSEDDIKLLEDVELLVGNVISQIAIFIDLFHQYIDLVQSAAIFSPDFVEPEQNDANVYPTQTVRAEPSNRAERRAKEKSLPFDKFKDIQRDPKSKGHPKE